MLCSGCEILINKDNFLKCNRCGSAYCYDCLNVTADLTKPLSAELLASLSCPSCQNVTRRKYDDDTPVRRSRKNKSQNIVNASFSQITEQNFQSVRNTSADASFINEPVSMESISKLFDLKLSSDSAFMTDLRTALKKDIERLVTAEVNRAVQEIKFDFTTTTDFIAAEQKDIKSDIADKSNQIKHLESELSKSQTALLKLENRLHTIEKISRDQNVELHEVPENKNENLSVLFKKLCECLQVVIPDTDIRACRRVAKFNSSSKRPRNILITLSSQSHRDALISAASRFNKKYSDDKLSTTHIGLTGTKSRIFVAEHLSPEAKELHSAARQFCREMSFKFVWVRFGQIYIRKNEKSPAILVKNLDTLNKLKSK